ncbi:protein HOMOLOG OF MAMMALIAN LYST-INTERACTING PROTEIN 5-like isoform X2 [Punica granatum]|uniref:Protein HOMOLOG OF MAMMALIAN LYST-INTERACTING PROTEIN 5-like isoform X2 n=1 Tax=Punica granatum TaxID=22663 RepID=A0A6P8DXL8_PUNGR|nr:protein HOMOLOG OF MAMMALIAN LYST-INTERACTING PROTEIN 5-like isoform X2 [Punica granatum]
MASDHEPAKILLPYLQRADELQEHEPLVAYNCRLYAMDRGPKIPAGERTKTANALLNSLIKQLEKLPIHQSTDPFICREWGQEIAKSWARRQFAWKGLP